MKHLLFIFVCFSFIGFKSDKSTRDFKFLCQNWCFSQYKAVGVKEITYNSSKEFGNCYGYQFRKDGTLTISRSVGTLPRDLETDFEEVKGKWKIVQDSILMISYKSNNQSYNEKLIVKRLNADDLVVHPQYEN